MRNNNLEQFIKLRRELTQEKEQLSRRLSQINEALGELSQSPQAGGSDAAEQASPQPQASASPAKSAGKPAAGRASTGRGGGRAGGGSLRELVIEVLREGPKTKEEVLKSVQQRGYKFQTNNPLNSLGVILYGKNPKLNRVDGKFSLPGGAAGGARGGAAAAGQSSGGGKREMSAAARERIAEAQRKRWAATRKDQDNNQAKQPAAQKNGAGSAGGKRQLSAAGRKAIAEAARKRWAAAKAAGKSRL